MAVFVNSRLQSERFSTGAGTSGLRVIEVEPFAFEAVAEVQLGAVDIAPAPVIEEDAERVDLDMSVGIEAGGVPAEVVRKSGAPTGHDRDSEERRSRVNTLFLSNFAQSDDGARGYADIHGDHWQTYRETPDQLRRGTGDYSEKRA